MFGNYRSLQHYLKDIFDILNCSDKVIVLASIYIERYFENKNLLIHQNVDLKPQEKFAICSRNAFFIIAACIVLAVKFYEEFVYINPANK